MALQWRTVSMNGSPTYAKQPHYGRIASRATVRVYASSFLNPHSVLGVSPTADVKEVKRAYRKLALQYHPDVCKSEDGHERFITLTQAYEMLLGRAEGKTDPNHASSSGWDFHDWYWNFRMQRSWEKQQRHAKKAAAAAAGAAADAEASSETADAGYGQRSPPHGQAGFKQPEARANLRSQLAGLRHRAAVRANRSAAASTSTSASAAASASCSAASGCSMNADGEDTGAWSRAAATAAAGGIGQQAAAAAHSTASPGSGGNGFDPMESGLHNDFSAWSWSWSWDETIESEDEQTVDAAPSAAGGTRESANGIDPRDVTHAAANLHHQHTHVHETAPAESMAMHDGHPGTVVANHAVPFPGSSLFGASAAGKQQACGSPQQQQETHQPLHDSEPEPEPFSDPRSKSQAHVHSQSQQQHQQQHYTGRRRFAADSASRELVSHQLAGLSRKATLKAAHCGGSASSDVGDDNTP